MKKKPLSPRWFIQFMAFSAAAAFILPFLTIFVSSVQKQLQEFEEYPTQKNNISFQNINKNLNQRPIKAF